MIAGCQDVSVSGCCLPVTDQENVAPFNHYRDNNNNKENTFKPAYVHGADHIIEKTYHLAPYFGPFEVYLSLGNSNGVQKVFSYSKIIIGTGLESHINFNLVKK